MKINNYSQISNEFIDSIMCKCSGSATKVFIAISRKTIGWHKISDRISQTQLMKITGLSKNSIRKAVDELVELKIIHQFESEFGYVYDINIDTEIIENESEQGQKLTEEGSKIEPWVSKIDTKTPKTVSKIDTTKEIFKEIYPEQTKQKKDVGSQSNRFKQVLALFHSDYQSLYKTKLDLTGKEIGMIKHLSSKPEAEFAKKYNKLKKMSIDNPKYYKLTPSTLAGKWNLLVDPESNEKLPMNDRELKEYMRMQEIELKRLQEESDKEIRNELNRK